MRYVLCALLVTIGCSTDDGETPAVAECHAKADRFCEALGLKAEGFCELVLRQDCSEVDAAAAHATCEAHPEIAADRRDGQCILLWR